MRNILVTIFCLAHLFFISTNQTHAAKNDGVIPLSRMKPADGRIAVWKHHYTDGCKQLQEVFITILKDHLKKKPMFFGLKNSRKIPDHGIFKAFFTRMVRKTVKAHGYKWLFDMRCKQEIESFFTYNIALLPSGNRVVTGHQLGNRNSFDNIKRNIALVIKPLGSKYRKKKVVHSNKVLRSLLPTKRLVAVKKPKKEKRLAIWIHNYKGNCWHFQRAVAEIVQANLKRKLAYYGFKNGIKTSKKRMYRFKQRRLMMYRIRTHHNYFIDVKCEQGGKKYIGYNIYLRQAHSHKATGKGSGYRFNDPADSLKNAVRTVLQNLKPIYLKKKVTYNDMSIQKSLSKMKPLEGNTYVYIPPKRNLQFAFGFGFNLFGSIRSAYLNSYMGCAVGLFRVRHLRIGLHYSACIGKSPAGEQFGLDMLHNPEFTVTAFKFGTTTRFNLVFGAGFLYQQTGMTEHRSYSFLSSHAGPSFSLSAELMPHKTPLRLNLRLSWTPGHLQTLNQPDYWDWGRVNLQFTVLLGN